MKKSLHVIGAIFTIFFCIGVVNAAPSQRFYTSAGSIEAGGKVTATLQLKNVAAWNVKITSNGATNGCDASFADATANGGNTTKNLSVTCTSTGVGQISFRVTGDATSADGSSTNISGVKVVTVTNPRPKDSNNYLKSLSVKDYQVTPAFNKDTLEYTVDVPSTVNKVTIEAGAESGYASVRGTGEMEVDEGSNSFEIVVTSETGSERTYKLLVNVKDENPINVSLNGQDFTIVKNAKNIEKPESYEVTTIKIDGMEIPAFVSDITGFTLVAVKNSEGNISFMIYHEENNTYEQYNEQKSSNMVIYIMEPEKDLENYIKTQVEINGVSYPAFKVNDNSEYAIVYGMNVETGQKDFYIYDAHDNVFQKYYDDMIQKLIEKELLYGRIILGCTCGLVLLFFLCIFAIFKKPSKKKMKKYLSRMKKKEGDLTPTNENNKPDKVTKKKKIKSKKEPVQEENKKSDEDEQLDVTKALEKMNNAEEIILEYEKTMSINKDEFEEL